MIGSTTATTPACVTSAPNLDLVDPRVAHELALRLADDAPVLYGQIVALLHRRWPTRLGGVDDVAAGLVAYGLERWPRALRDTLMAFVGHTYGPSPSTTVPTRCACAALAGRLRALERRVAALESPAPAAARDGEEVVL